MSRPAPGLVYALFAVVLIAVASGSRLIQLPGTAVALIWPASGVCFLWLLWARGNRARVLCTVVGIVVILVPITVLTGSSWASAFLYGPVNVLQAYIALKVFTRFVPGARSLRVRDFFGLLVSALAGASLGGILIAAVSAALGNPDALSLFLPWVVRNSVSLTAVSAVGLVLYREMFEHPYPAVKGRHLELVLLCAVTTGLYVLGVTVFDGLPVAFMALPPTIWASLRFRTPTAVLHALGSGAVLIVLTLNGRGPFQDLGSGTEAYLAQTLLLVAFSFTAVLAFTRDELHQLIADLDTSHREAQEAADLRDLVMAAMSDGIFVLSADGNTLLHNSYGRKLLTGTGLIQASPHADHRNPASDQDIQLDPLLNQNPATSSPPTDTSDSPSGPVNSGHPLTPINPVMMALQGGATHRAPLTVLGAHDQALHLLIDAEPLSTPKGTGALVVFHDITKERGHQDKLTRFASVVAHDLNQPLTVFDGWLEMLEDSHDQETFRAEALARMSGASTRMRDLIKDLLVYSSSTHRELHVIAVRIADMIRTVTDAHTALPPGSSGTEPQFSIDAPAVVSADPVLIRQLLENLIGNAVKYADPEAGAVITIRSDNDAGTGFSSISVADNGIGIPESDLDTVFQEFHRSANGTHHAAGTGLGLAICQRIVESHGGTIGVRNQSQGGCIITFTLPTTPPEVTVKAGAEVDTSSEELTRKPELQSASRTERR